MNSESYVTQDQCDRRRSCLEKNSREDTKNLIEWMRRIEAKIDGRPCGPPPGRSIVQQVVDHRQELLLYLLILLWGGEKALQVVAAV
ncbi:MAG: hypothetical protein QMD46_12270 [Methanomicrobiales archaeon]|nr:hypothetical protein [Methanomicrobiales archaeon]